MSRRAHRQYPLPLDDGFRSLIATVIGGILIAGALALMTLAGVVERDALLTPAGTLSIACAFWVLFSVIYLTWTHLVHARCPDDVLRRVADVQHHRRPSNLEIFLGLRITGTGTLSAAFFALFAAVGTSFIGIDTAHVWRLALVVLTVASAWATMVYAFALRYLRLDAAGERITFDIDEQPRFGDFLSMGAMVSAVGAMSAGTPRTSAGLRAVRTHTLFAFVFNTFIVAMTVSLVVGLISL